MNKRKLRYFPEIEMRILRILSGGMLSPNQISNGTGIKDTTRSAALSSLKHKKLIREKKGFYEEPLKINKKYEITKKGKTFVKCLDGFEQHRNIIIPIMEYSNTEGKELFNEWITPSKKLIINRKTKTTDSKILMSKQSKAFNPVFETIPINEDIQIESKSLETSSDELRFLANKGDVGFITEKVAKQLQKENVQSLQNLVPIAVTKQFVCVSKNLKNSKSTNDGVFYPKGSVNRKTVAQEYAKKDDNVTPVSSSEDLLKGHREGDYPTIAVNQPVDTFLSCELGVQLETTVSSVENEFIVCKKDALEKQGFSTIYGSLNEMAHKISNPSWTYGFVYRYLSEIAPLDFPELRDFNAIKRFSTIEN